MVRMKTVGPHHVADVLSCECVPELLGLPELGRNLRWRDEFVAGGPLAPGALAIEVV